MLRAYNDWALEYMAFAPHALAVVAQLPTHDPAAAVEELQRVARAGHRGVQLGPHESETPPFEDAWLPFWAAAEEAGLPVSFHINGGVRSIRSILGSWRRPAMVSVLPFQLDETISGLVFSGILARHPRLRVVMAESGIGWLPYFFDRLDLEHVNYQPDTSDVVLAEPPSFYLKRQVRFTWGDDRIGAVLIPDLGADCVMWASDYPHADSTWPNSREVLSTLLAHLSEADRGKVTRDNAEQLYALSPDSPACG